MRFHVGSILAVTFLSSAVAHASILDGVVVFGDSLSDCGNVFAMTGGALPYPSGRFTNGPVWAEHLAVKLGTTLQPSLLGGSGYAYGGAESGLGTSLLRGVLPVPAVRQQVQGYVGSATPLDPNKLFVIWGGANDFLNGQANPAIPANNITSAVSDLANAGAKHILVVDLPNLGLTPEFRGTPYQDPMTRLSEAFNAYLTIDLQTIPGALIIGGDADKLVHPDWGDNPGLTIYHLPLNQLFEDMIVQPADYSFTNVVDPVFNGTTVIGDPDAYLFWDSVHPTTIAQATLGNAAYALVATPEPSALGLLGLGCAALLCRRRGRPWQREALTA